MPVPFADLHAQYLSIKTDIDVAIADVIRASSFIRGPQVERFEVQFANAVDAKYCISCGNGTDALYIAMRAIGIKPGDEVITTAHSWISTSATITQSGGKVVFCDTEADTYTIDPLQIESQITPRTVGILPVHLYGQPADMDAIMAIAEKHGLWVIEDCAQAHSARYKGKMVGGFGIAGTYSFYPGKNLGAMGDAGALVTNDKSFADRAAMIARHGGLIKGDHQVEGINSRLDSLQAAVLSVKLQHLPRWTSMRQRAATLYGQYLRGIDGLALPGMASGREHVWHLYVVQHDDRDALSRHLHGSGIQTAIHYPVALPFLPAYKRLDHHPEDFPVAYRQQSRILSLPMFAEISEEQITLVTDAIRSF